MLHSIYYIFRALKALHQEDSCKNIGILWYNVCSRILRGGNKKFPEFLKNLFKVFVQVSNLYKYFK
jgi:hypothetical protein